MPLGSTTRPAQYGEKRSGGSRLLALLRRSVLLVLLAYGMVLLLLFFSQEAMIFPGRATRGTPEARVVPPAGTELLYLGPPYWDERIAALFGPALAPDGSTLPDPRSRPTLLYFYGNGTCLATSLEQFDRLRRLGANVMIPEYAGYGMSSGSAGEKGCYLTAEAAYRALCGREEVDPERIVAAGSSLGGAVAVELAVRQPVAGLAVFNAFSSMTEMARGLFPYLPEPAARLLLRHRFENLEKIRRLQCPVFVGWGGRDEVVPPTMSERLAAAAPGPVKTLCVPEAGHSDFFELGGDSITGEFRAFLVEVGQGAHSRRRASSNSGL